MARIVALVVSTVLILNSTLGWAQQGQQNTDLFPPIANNPTLGNGQDQGPITIDEGDGDLPVNPGGGFDPFPFPLPLPGGGYDPGYGGSNRPGRPNFPVDPPVQGNEIRIAQVPGQYSCPLFENNSYHDLNLAIANLTNAIQNVSDECRSSQNQIDSLRQTNDQIKDSITKLQDFVSKPEESYANTQSLQTNITTLVTGIDRMSDIFKNTTALSNACGRKTMSWGRVALELSNVVNSASPFLLMLLAANPALSLTIKATIMGGVVATNAVAAMSQVIASNTVNMEIADQRNAVLQNACQYTKVARKIRYIQLAQSGRFEQLEKELTDNVKSYSVQMFGNMQFGFNDTLSLRTNVRNNIGAIQANVRIDREALNEINQRIREAQGNALLVCLEGQQLALTAQDETSFPNTVTGSILDAYDQQKYLKNIDLNDFQINFGDRGSSQDENDLKLKKKVQSLISYYQKLMATLTSYESPPKADQTSNCAAVTMAMTQHIGRMINETTKIMIEDLDKFEEELQQDPDYRKWKEQFDKVTVEKENTNRMARVLKELTNAGAAVYNRSEFNEAANGLKRSLLGPRSGFFGGDSPVYAWLDYKNRQFSRSLGSFQKSVTLIKNKAFKLTQSGQTNYYGAGGIWAAQQIAKDVNLIQDLKVLNTKTLPLNSKQWELACIDLEKAIKDFSEALDHLGTTHFMCDMIWDHLDNSVDKKIMNYCRGVTDYSGVQAGKNKSSYDKAYASLDKKNSMGPLSYNQMARVIAKKMMEVKCPLPKAAESVN